LIWAAPVFAQDPLAPLSAPKPGAQSATPAQPVNPAPAQLATVAAPKDWRGVFDAIDAGNWRAAQAGIAALPQGILTPVAKAELYTAKGSPAVDVASLQALIAQAPELPQADQLALMAYKRGATDPIRVYPERPTMNLGSAPVRYRARPVQGEAAADELRGVLDPLVKADDASGAEAALLQYAPQLSVEARAEAGARVAFVYYVLGLDLDARRVADTWRVGATGDWAPQAAWTSGLASWRLNDCESASRAFQEVTRLAQQRELRAGGFYWAARAEQLCRRPQSVEPLLRQAATSAESFYGLLARESLGMDTRLPPDPYVGRDPSIDHLVNVQRAAELARIGEPALAEEMLRHQAKIGLPSEHHALIQLAKRLDLPGAQLWLANNGQPGAISDSADRYPNPRWSPLTGWRVDPALAFGHVVQESSFRRTAVSPAGAVGLMQVRPGSAGDMARARGLGFAPAMLTDPRANLEFGQSYIEMLRSQGSTAGQLPRVIAAYNAGPTPVSRWAGINDKGDPLLWIESIPYWETRYYVPSVLRNMWVYQGLNREGTPTLKAMAEHRWPAFPTGMTRLSH
jgi:soluble lytic murein transglycosylase-like protein